MILLSEINEASKRFQVPAETIEKDYAISWILYCLSKSLIKNNFTFYGGTAIKRIYFEEHRFSEDIDLISSDFYSQDAISKELEILKLAKDKINLDLKIDENSWVIDKNRSQVYIQYNGYEEIVGSPKKIRVDCNMKMDMFGETEERKLIKSYSDLKNENEALKVMTLNTIFANKLGLLLDMTRNEPRDVFDIWFLLKRKNKFDFNVNKIREIFKRKYGYSPAVNLFKTKLSNQSLKDAWDMRLSKQISELPAADQIIKEITILLEKIF